MESFPSKLPNRHLEHDENGVIFDVVVDRNLIFNAYNAAHGAEISVHKKSALANPTLFIDNEGTERERR
jgi:hypothetical protein